MGRRKIKIQPLPNSQIRAKFKKRKLGLVKKAYELGTLCGAQVALIIFSKDGKEVIDKGYNATTLEIIQRYWREVRCKEQIPVLQIQQFQPNSDSSSQGIPMDPCAQQEVAMDPNMQQDQFMNPQEQQDQYMNPEVQQDRYMNPEVQQDQYMNPQMQQEVPMDSNMQQILYMNPGRQQEVSIDPCLQQDQYVNLHRQQEVSTDPRTRQQALYVNPHGRQPLTGISNMQQGMQYSMGTNFVDTSNCNYMQDCMADGNQQFHAQGRPTQFENQTNARYNGELSGPGYRS